MSGRKNLEKKGVKTGGQEGGHNSIHLQLHCSFSPLSLISPINPPSLYLLHKDCSIEILQGNQVQVSTSNKGKKKTIWPKSGFYKTAFMLEQKQKKLNF